MSGVDLGSAAGTRCVESRNAESRNDRGGRGRDGPLDGPRTAFCMGSKGLTALGQRRVDKVLGREEGAFAGPSILCLYCTQDTCWLFTVADHSTQDDLNSRLWARSSEVMQHAHQRAGQGSTVSSCTPQLYIYTSVTRMVTSSDSTVLSTETWRLLRSHTPTPVDRGSSRPQFCISMEPAEPLLFRQCVMLASAVAPEDSAARLSAEVWRHVPSQPRDGLHCVGSQGSVSSLCGRAVSEEVMRPYYIVLTPSLNCIPSRAISQSGACTCKEYYKRVALVRHPSPVKYVGLVSDLR